MSELRDRFETARDGYHRLRYPGDLAGDAAAASRPARRFTPARWAAVAAAIVAGAGLIWVSNREPKTPVPVRTAAASPSPALPSLALPPVSLAGVPGLGASVPGLSGSAPLYLQTPRGLPAL